MFGHIRLISFDLDETLWPLFPVIAEAEQASYDWMAGAAPRLTARHTIDELRLRRRDLARRRPEIAHDMTLVRLHSLAELMTELDYGFALAEQATAVFRSARNRVTPYAEVVEVLARLRTRYCLVSVTNGNAEIEQTPLRDSFDYSFTAADVGAAKPDPAIFHAAAEQAGVALGAFLHVGDDPFRDVQAARGLGLSTVWVNREAGDWPAELDPPDLEIGDLTVLAEHLMR